jgi:hypothetical protein
MKSKFLSELSFFKTFFFDFSSLKHLDDFDKKRHLWYNLVSWISQGLPLE